MARAHLKPCEWPNGRNKKIAKWRLNATWGCVKCESMECVGRKVRLLKSESARFGQFSLSLYWTQFVSTGVSKHDSEWDSSYQISLFDFYRMNWNTVYFAHNRRLTNKSSKTAFELIMKKLRNMGQIISHGSFQYVFPTKCKLWILQVKQLLFKRL